MKSYLSIYIKFRGVGYVMYNSQCKEKELGWEGWETGIFASGILYLTVGDKQNERIRWQNRMINIIECGR